MADQGVRRKPNSEIENRLAELEAKSTKYAIHSTGSISPTNDIAALKFQNIDTSKRYRLTTYHQVAASGAYTNNLTVRDGVGGTGVLTHSVAEDGGQSQANSAVIIFEPGDLSTGILSFDFTRSGSSNSILELF